MGKKRFKYHDGPFNKPRRFPKKRFQPTTNPDFISSENEQRKVPLPDPPGAMLKTFNFSGVQLKNSQSNSLHNFESTTNFHGIRAEPLCRRPLHPVLGASENREGWNYKRKCGRNPPIFGGTPNLQNLSRPEMKLTTFGDNNFISKTASPFSFANFVSDFTWWSKPKNVSNTTSQKKSLNKPPGLISCANVITSTPPIPFNRSVTVNMNNHPTYKYNFFSTIPIVHNQGSNQEDDVTYLFTVDSSTDGRIVEEINLCQPSASVHLIAPKGSSIEQIDLTKETETAKVALQSSNNAKLIIKTTLSSPNNRKRKIYHEAEISSKRQNTKYLQIRCSDCKIDYEELNKKGKQMYIAASCGHSYCYACAQRDKKVCMVCQTKVSSFCRQYR